MWVTWLFVAFAIAMVVGPVMLLRPTPGMSKIAAIRAYANKKGLDIRLPANKIKPGPRNIPQGAYYTLSLNEKIRKMGALEPWGLEKQQQTHEIHFQGEWDWTDKNRPREALVHDIYEAIASAPEGVRGASFNASGISVLWDENCRGKAVEAAVDEIIDYLNRLLDIVVRHPLPVEKLEDVDLDALEEKDLLP